MTGEKTYKANVVELESPNDADMWEEFSGGLYRCQVYLYPEDDGRFSAIAASLPGVASQGRTEADALANVTEALEGAIADYKESGQSIPWADPVAPPEENAITRWVFARGD